jgi:hypothetical protein
MAPRPQPDGDGDGDQGEQADEGEPGDGNRGDGPREIIDEARDELEYPEDETGEG